MTDAPRDPDEAESLDQRQVRADVDQEVADREQGLVDLEQTSVDEHEDRLVRDEERVDRSDFDAVIALVQRHGEVDRRQVCADVRQDRIDQSQLGGDMTQARLDDRRSRARPPENGGLPGVPPPGEREIVRSAAAAQRAAAARRRATDAAQRARDALSRAEAAERCARRLQMDGTTRRQRD